ncbi:glycosyltransferase family 61 protein [Natronoglomus mannanivorans]|uniref:glycosyltransferase family 61 protein n=1 Tax=Natronoglomus mannanivorans TaxID=2979990 RepID=UPI003083A67D
MDLFRQASRKVHRDGANAFLSEVHEEIVREKVLRRYIDANVNYERDTVTVADLTTNAEQFSLEDSIEPRVTQIPPKQSNESVADVPDRSFPTQQCGILRDATVLAPAGLVRSPNGQYVADSVGPINLTTRRVSVSLSMFGYEFGINQLRKTLSAGQRKENAAVTVDEAIVLMPLWPNYFHWTVEGLLKLHWLERYVKQTNTTPTILVPENLSSWMRESLTLLGYDSEDCLAVGTARTQVNRLLVPSQPEPIIEHTRWLRNQMLDAVDSPRKGARIYISRRNATKRQVVNEESVSNALQRLGFETYALEELSVEEQVELFSDAEVVVGPHGAGLANLVYADDPLVVELFGRKRLNTYHRLATALGFEYEPVYCDSRGTDLVVDSEELTERLSDHINM